MGFLPIVYAGAYFLAACVGCALCKLVPAWRTSAMAVFLSILAFGACSYVGFIAGVLILGATPFRGLLEGGSRGAVYVVSYVLPGVLGAWVSVKAIRSMVVPRQTP
jgi:hypothetical protein